jgi:geranylgeranyl diphosphate synthase type II
MLVKELMQNDLFLFEQFFQKKMQAWFYQDSSRKNDLNQAILYSLQAGGKRIRPLLTLATTRIFAGDENVSKIIGCSLEMMHTYSLIHDDLPAMDNDDFRRGKPSCHKAFSEAIAILAGDALLNEAPLFLLKELRELKFDPQLIIEMVQQMLQTCGHQGMVLGQAFDLEYEKIDHSKLEQAKKLIILKEIHQLKTGGLLSLAVQLGAMVSHSVEHPNFKLIKKLGDDLGLVFQVIDDILDVTSSLDQLGKTPGKDLLANKLTYPAVLGLHGAKLYALEVFQEIEVTLAKLDRKNQALLASIIKSLKDKIYL